MVNIKVKKLTENAVIPTYAKPGDAGMDVTATSVTVTEDYIQYGTGLSFELPEGYVMLIFPRSSNSKKDLLLCNSVGVLDSGYRGELMLRFKQLQTKTGWIKPKVYEVGERVGQIMIIPYPTINIEEVSELSESERGTGGFGSSGK